MRRIKIVAVIASILVVLCVAFMLLPSVLNAIGKKIADDEINRFDLAISNMVEDLTVQEAKDKGRIDDEGYLLDDTDRTKRICDTPVLFKADLDRLYEDSVTYNNSLKENQRDWLKDEYSYIYPSINLSDYGIYNGCYGYISAPSVGMKLPIYLGANNTNMALGAAHLTYTSLPIGGEKTNCVLAGHTGYIGRVLFDNIGYLNIGDKVEITNYWENIEYKVVEKKVYAPNQSQDIFINSDKDVLTAITCIGDGHGGFNRLFVICERE